MLGKKKIVLLLIVAKMKLLLDKIVQAKVIQILSYVILLAIFAIVLYIV